MSKELDELLALPPGSALDAAVCEHVLRWKRPADGNALGYWKVPVGTAGSYVWEGESYCASAARVSTDLTTGELHVGRALREKGYYLSLEDVVGGKGAYAAASRKHGGTISEFGDTFTHALCRVALRVEFERKGK